MGNYVHRINKGYFQSIPPNELPEPVSNYISDPDMSALQGVPAKYWKIAGDTVVEMSQVEKDSVDTGIVNTRRDAAVENMFENLEGNLRQLVKLMIRENNILRAQHGLSDRTINQFKTEIRNGYGL